MVFAEEELELVTGGADGKFLVWQMPSLVLKQRFTRSNASPLVSEARGGHRRGGGVHLLSGSPCTLDLRHGWSPGIRKIGQVPRC